MSNKENAMAWWDGITQIEKIDFSSIFFPQLSYQDLNHDEIFEIYIKVKKSDAKTKTDREDAEFWWDSKSREIKMDYTNRFFPDKAYYQLNRDEILKIYLNMKK